MFLGGFITGWPSPGLEILGPSRLTIAMTVTMAPTTPTTTLQKLIQAKGLETQAAAICTLWIPGRWAGPATPEVQWSVACDSWTIVITHYYTLHSSLLSIITLGPRQWPEVSDFVACFCTLRESESVRFSHVRVFSDSRNVQKKCDTNHIPRATAYFTLSSFTMLIHHYYILLYWLLLHIIAIYHYVIWVSSWKLYFSSAAPRRRAGLAAAGQGTPWHCAFAWRRMACASFRTLTGWRRGSSSAGRAPFSAAAGAGAAGAGGAGAALLNSFPLPTRLLQGWSERSPDAPYKPTMLPAVVRTSTQQKCQIRNKLLVREAWERWEGQTTWRDGIVLHSS